MLRFADVLVEMTLDNPYPITDRNIVNLKRRIVDGHVCTTFHARYLVENKQSDTHNWIVEIESTPLQGTLNVMPNPNRFFGWHVLTISFGTSRKNDNGSWVFNRTDYDGKIQVGTPTRLFATIRNILLKDIRTLYYDDLKDVVGTIAFSSGPSPSRGREAVYDRLAQRMAGYLHFRMDRPARGLWMIENPQSPHGSDPSYGEKQNEAGNYRW